jgi:anti-anti-sigma factor
VSRCLDELRGQLPCQILLNLSGLQYIGSLALGALVSLHHAVKRQAGTLWLVIDNAFLVDCLERMGLDRLFHIVRGPGLALA